MKKNIVYCCVFYNKDYFKLLHLLLVSLRFFSDYDNGTYDFLVITHESMVDEVNKLMDIFKINIFIHTFNFNTIFQSACARLHIFEYPLISNYEKILYIDTDIIIKKNLSPLFDVSYNDLLYGFKSGNINSFNFGKQFFDFTTIDSSLTGFNSGTLLFNNNQILKDLFNNIIEHINMFIKTNQVIPTCMDQPFINYHAIKSNTYDNNKHSTHFYPLNA